MMTMKTIARTLLASLTLLCASFALAPFALAQRETLNIQPSLSTVGFTLDTNHDTVNGTFRVEKGSVSFDPSSRTLSGLIVVSASSGNSGNASRDKKMLKDILQVSKFADVSFAPQSYTGTIAPMGDSTLQVTGVFTLHGTPHTLTVPMQLHINDNQCTAQTTFKVPYVQWGLKDPSWFVLKAAKEVDVKLSLAGAVSPAK